MYDKNHNNKKKKKENAIKWQEWLFPIYDAMRIHSFYSLKKIYINSSKLLN